MTNKKTAAKGIYCLETESWDTRKDTATVEPVLHLLKQVRGGAPYLHKDIATRAELRYFLKQYTMSTFDNYPILYLGFHGQGAKRGEAGLYLNEGEDIFLTELAEVLKDSLKGRVVYFGACGIMKAQSALQSFRSATKAGAILGYEKNTYWIESAVFDLLVLSYLQEVNFNHSTSFKGMDNKLKNRAGVLYNQLGFKIMYIDS